MVCGKYFVAHAWHKHTESLFKGPDAVYKQIKLASSPDQTGCFVTWAGSGAGGIKKHRDSNLDWGPMFVGLPFYPHWRADAGWVHGKGMKMACVHPLTWANSIGEGGGGEPEEWKGMLARGGRCFLSAFSRLPALHFLPRDPFAENLHTAMAWLRSANCAGHGPRPTLPSFVRGTLFVQAVWKGHETTAGPAPDSDMGKFQNLVRRLHD